MPAHAHGRSLKQLGYDPYGIGYYDPYQAGVTPGFVNVDLNRETGLHVDVGTVAVDVSADKNYYGLGVGNLVGVGAAKDRGWNLQIGGGNILDVSVTKDAGLGLWLLNGLANIQIGPDGRGWETGHIAAQSVPGQASAAVAGTAGQPAGQQVTSVVVDEPPAGDGKAAAAAAVAGEVHAASDSAEATAVEEPIITEEPISPELTAEVAGMGEEALQAATAAAPQPSAAAAAAAARSSAARRAKPRKYIEARPAVYVQPRPVVVATEEDTLGAGAAQFDGAAAAAAAAAVPQYASQPAAGVQPAVVPFNAAVPPYAPAGVVGVQQVPAVAAAAAAAPRRACEGGVMVAVAGNKLKCRYRKGSRPAQRAQAGVASPQ